MKTTTTVTITSIDRKIEAQKNKIANLQTQISSIYAIAAAIAVAIAIAIAIATAPADVRPQEDAPADAWWGCTISHAQTR